MAGPREPGPGEAAAGALSARGAARRRRRDSLPIGVLPDTRGLTELVVLNVGLEAGVIGSGCMRRCS
ncbi:hypothetical protein ABT215_27195 [Streptomyces sp900105755]|uniref:hypothetical protein n=1 Tax=Streptomyces sp. 900105755 TaxID=3154389 RepID=UPI00331C6B75